MSAAKILVVDDEGDIRDLLREILTEEGYDVRVAADAAHARAARAATEPDLVLLDIWMPDADGISLLREWRDADVLNFPVVMMSGHGTVDTAVEATRLGAFDYVEKPLSLTKLLHTVERALHEGRRSRGGARKLVPPVAAPVGKSRIMQTLRDQAKRVARHDTPVLISGEPGSGREAFGRYVHAMSDRAQGNYVVLVASALTDDNAEEQLYGAEREGAIEPGYLERARGGVLFISELEDLCPAAQRLLVGAIEQESFIRMGGREPVRLDVRFVSSIRRQEAREQSRVREDLLALLGVVPLQIPPLRDYGEDVPDLLRYYAEKLADTEGLPLRRFTVAAQNRLRHYPWPGNVRELKNMVHRLLILGGGEEITLEEVERQLAADSPPSETFIKQDLLALPLREAREQFERAYLQQQLLLCGGKVGLLAKRVGMERTHLYRKLRSLGVDFRQSTDD
jgi:two-component system, NtrC family, nitrogen regulation response regulator NtrX